jgi:hypothetical protein
MTPHGFASIVHANGINALQEPLVPQDDRAEETTFHLLTFWIEVLGMVCRSTKEGGEDFVASGFFAGPGVWLQRDIH